MAQYINKDTLIAEIERLKECNRKICAGDFDFLKKTYPEHYYSTEIYNDILSFLNTLEVKEEVTTTDAFVKKACEWLGKNLSKYSELTDEDEYGNKLNEVVMNIFYGQAVNDFKNYMKGE